MRVPVTSLFSMFLSCLLLTHFATAWTPSPPKNTLVVYTYESMLASGPTAMNLSALFCPTVGLPASCVQVYRLPSGCLLSSLCADASCMPAQSTSTCPLGSSLSIPPADVVLGVDSLQEQSSTDMFLSFTSPSESNFVPVLNTFGHPDHSKPFDYAATTISFDAHKLPSLLSRVGTFTLETLFQTNLIHSLVIENPTLDTSGLNFLLWTISVYGDASLGITGQVSDPTLGDWRNWWRRAFASNASIVDGWDSAFAQFVDPTDPHDLMVDYGTSPAYSVCTQSNTSVIKPLISHAADGSSWAWFQVETVAVSNTSLARNASLAQSFVNFLLAPSMQSNLYLNQYMLPVNSNSSSLPACYLQADTIQLSDVQILNTRLTSAQIKQYLQQWLTDWQTLYNNRANSLPVTPTALSTAFSSSAPSLLVSALSLVLVMLLFSL